MKRSPLVLLIEEDARLATYIERALLQVGFAVEQSCTSAAARSLVDTFSPGLVIADLDAGAIAELRALTCVPLLMLSREDTVAARVAALDAGADDCLAIPFATEELVARMRALLRGRELASGERHPPLTRLTYADVCLDLDAREAWRGARRLELRNKGFELLACFLRHPERVLSRRDLLGEVWGYEFLGDSNVIDVTVSHLRQALEAAGERRLIKTVRPIGYILNARCGSS